MITAIIPLAGIGSRLRPHTHTQPKAMVPVAGKPILAHIMDNLIEHGVESFVLVIGYFGDKIQTFVTQNYPKQNVHFVVQEFKEGIGHAIWLSQKYINANDEMLIVLGDTIFNVDLSPMLSSPNSVIGVKKVADPRMFGVAELNDTGGVEKLVEKPLIPKSNLAMVGLYKIKEAQLLIQALDENIKSNLRTHNEFQLTDGLMNLIKKGIKIETFTVDDWYDCGNKEVLLETNAMLLNRRKTLVDPKKFDNIIIIPPVSISENCKIANSIIGPNVSIGDNVVINQSIIKNSIIGSFSQLDTVLLHDSLVGSDAILKGLSQSLNLGDNTEISFS